jgi:hypothetical protein
MAGHNKLNMKIQIKISEKNKQDLDHDIPILAKQIREQTGTDITRSDFLRLVLEDLHKTISGGGAITWPPKLIPKRGKWKKKP